MSGVIEAPATTRSIDAALEIAAPHLRPILVAVRDWRVGMLFVSQGSDAFAIPSSGRAAVVMVGDDMHCSRGPDGFHARSLRRAIKACAAFGIIAGEPLTDVYTAVTAVAVGGRHSMIIETRPEHEIQWARLVQELAPKRPLILSTVKGGRA